jgi:hypothetical protein
MDFAKRLISLGVFAALPYDAGPLLRIITTESMYSSKKIFDCNFIAPSSENVIIQYSKDIFPFFRLFSSEEADPFVIGYAYLFENGVGRIMILSKFHNFASRLKELCAPCLCKAGHLLVLRFRVSENQITCSCSSSTLKCIEDSWALADLCAVSGEKQIPFRVYQNHAIALIDQRARLRIVSGPR